MRRRRLDPGRREFLKRSMLAAAALPAASPSTVEAETTSAASTSAAHSPESPAVAQLVTYPRVFTGAHLEIGRASCRERV